KDPSSTLVAHENFMHLVMTDDPAKAREEQHRAFLQVMSSERGPDYLESVYLFGTPDEVIASLQARVDAGVEYFFLHTMTPDPAQLQSWVDEIIPNVTFPASAGPVRRPPTPPPAEGGAGPPAPAAGPGGPRAWGGGWPAASPGASRCGQSRSAGATRRS